MRAVVFRGLAGLAGVLFVVGGLLMANDGAENAIVIVPLATLFLAYAALGEQRIQWLMVLFGAKPKIEQRSGKKGDRGW